MLGIRSAARLSWTSPIVRRTPPPPELSDLAWPFKEKTAMEGGQYGAAIVVFSQLVVVGIQTALEVISGAVYL